MVQHGLATADDLGAKGPNRDPTSLAHLPTGDRETSVRGTFDRSRAPDRRETM